MKKITCYVAVIMLSITLSACSALNTSRLINAGGYAAAAFTITDRQVAELSADAVKVMDLSNKVAPAGSEYTRRLNRLTANVREINGIKLNFKVYQTSEINAFATGDGSIRVYSGLMDAMDDSELMAIIGHEIGHIVHADVKTSMRNTYLAYAVKEALAATDNTVATLTDSQLGEIAVAFTQAQFSQKQEFAADDYGFEFSVKQGYSPYSMGNALQKLVEISGGSQASLVQKWFSSHPDNAERAKRVKEKADKYKK